MQSGQRFVPVAIRRLLTVAIVAVLAFSAGSALVAYGSHTGPTYYGCITSKGGTLYNVNTNGVVSCKSGDIPVSWNQDGPQGLQGPAGPQGEQGIQGQAGPQGEQGPAGPAGPQGETGAAGPQGEMGPAGPEGRQGPPGIPGQQGIPGPQGPAGASGMTGLEWVSFTRNYGPLEYSTTVDANCPAGKVAVAGGFDKSSGETEIYRSMPILNEANVATGWRVFGEMAILSVHGEWSVTAFALCATAP